MCKVVVAEDPLGPAIALDAFDHRGVIQRIGIDDQPREQLGQRRQRRVIGDIGRGKDQRGFLGVQIGQFGLQPLVIDGRARDIARAARPGARAIQRLMHGVQHDGMLAHPQIIIAAPDGDVLFFTIGTVPDGLRKTSLRTFDVDEGAIATFFVKLGNGVVQGGVIVHRGRSLALLARCDHCPITRGVALIEVNFAKKQV